MNSSPSSVKQSQKSLKNGTRGIFRSRRSNMMSVFKFDKVFINYSCIMTYCQFIVKTVRISYKLVYGVFLRPVDQIWLPFLKLTKSSLIIHVWWHTVTFVSNKVRIGYKFVYGVFFGREDQIWRPFLKLTKSSLIIHA